jgi:hypothetical protein
MAYKFNPFTGNLDEVGAGGGGGGTPGGADTQVQFNDGGAFGGDAGLSYNKTTDKLSVGGDLDLGTVGTFSTTLQTVTPTANRTVSIPDATGTIGLVNGPTGSIQFNEAGALNGTSDFSTTLNWNEASTTFTGLKLNVTDTFSFADSKLLDLQVGGSSKFEVDKYGGAYAPRTALNGGTIAGYFFDSPGNVIGFRADSNNNIGVFTRGTQTYSSFMFGATNRPIFKLGDAFSIAWGSNSVAEQANEDVALARDSAGVVKVTDGSTGTGYLKLIPTTVGALTAAATVGAGTKAFVTDANATTFASVVAGGGSNVVPVYSDGTDWRIG